MDSRFKHHPPTSDDVIEAHQTIREECDQLYNIICYVVPESYERDMAIVRLEECMMWANAGIARNQ